MVKFGDQCRDFLDGTMRNLHLREIQCDEIWTFVAKKQQRLTTEERELRGDIGDMYLWTALDRDTKLVPTFVVGKRSADMARRLMVDLYSRLAHHRPHDSDNHDYRDGKYERIITLFTDGFPGYPEAVDLAFGPYVEFGTLIKDYRNASLKGAYTPPEIVGTKRTVHRGSISEFDICTSHVERNNFTIRTSMKRFARLSLGFSKKLENLAVAVAMHMAYYNFCWQPATLGGCNTPARAAGITDRPWSFEELFESANG